MSIYNRFFKSKSQDKHNIDITAVSVIPTKCPTCGNVGDFQYDKEKHDFIGAIELDSKTYCHVLECPYCKAGMLLCIRDDRFMGIEPFNDDMSDVPEAVSRTRKKLGL